MSQNPPPPPGNQAQPAQPVQICCVGAGRLGVLSMLVLASQCQNVVVTVTDTDAAKIEAWDRNMPVLNPLQLRLPVYEPGLQELFMQVKATNRFFFSDYVAPSIVAAELIFIAVDIPSVKPPASKKGRKELADLDFVCRICRDINDFQNKVVITISSVSPDFKERIRQIFQVSDRFLYNPSFMRGGTAIEDLLNPSQVIIAYESDANPPVIDILDYTGVNSLLDLYLQWIPEENIRVINGFAPACLGKFAVNLGVATSISTANSLSKLCNEWGVNFSSISGIISRHPDLRVDPFNPPPGVGFGGELVDDLSHMSLMASSNDLTGVGAFCNSIAKVNELMKKTVVNEMQCKMNSLKGKKIAILGFTNRLNTEDVKNSPAIHISQQILKNGATHLHIFDPKAGAANIRRSFRESERKKVLVMTSGEQACNGVDAILVLMNWPEFLHLNYANIHQFMTAKSRRDIFIGLHFANFPNLVQLGFRVHFIGRQ